ncbi:hypothetical protein [Kitasatospora sp. NBC_00458]|uniref:hypothetical protein n=1 Tax=Kitasatospora sp. NBC_00458 TaxID=2903568 RepID=UPI002E188887
MELHHSGRPRDWLNPVKTRQASAEVDTPLGAVRIHRRHSGDLTPFGGYLERWTFSLDGSDVLSVDGMSSPGYPARGRIRRGLGLELLGQSGRLCGSRPLRPSRRHVTLSAGETLRRARPAWPGLVVVDGGGTPRIRFDGARWSFTAPEETDVAFAALFVAARLDPFMTSPLLEIL